MYDCAKPKKKRTTSTLIIRKCLFLFYQDFKQQCLLFHSAIKLSNSYLFS